VLSHRSRDPVAPEVRSPARHAPLLGTSFRCRGMDRGIEGFRTALGPVAGASKADLCPVPGFPRSLRLLSGALRDAALRQLRLLLVRHRLLLRSTNRLNARLHRWMPKSHERFLRPTPSNAAPIPANAMSRRAAAPVCTTAGRALATTIDNIPSMSSAPVQRGRTPARTTA
jgi:hypothetical protein